MGGFLLSFSDSFLLAVLLWPFIAAFLTLPILVVQYRRYNQIVWRRAIGIYLFILYGLGLLSFTLYPMPDNPVAFCQAYQLSPQLVPFTFISDIAHDGTRAILQVVMNIAFFIPLGVFARLFFRWKFIPTLIIAGLVSLSIETAQLTGAFGYYPCSYRLFDVDDLLINTIGGIIGYSLAALIPRKEIELAERHALTKNPGALRRLATLAVDQVIVMIVTAIVLLAIYFIIGKDVAMDSRSALYIIMFGLFQFAIPYLNRGQTLAAVITRATLDTHSRLVVRRTLYYSVRFTYLLGIFFGPDWLQAILVIIIVIVWLWKKRLPYSFI